jgi:hypothetical protein
MRTLLNIMHKHDDLSLALKEMAELTLYIGVSFMIAPSIIWLAWTGI